MSNYTADQLTLLDHLNAEAEATRKEVEAGKWDWASSYTCDLDHWAEMGVKSVADLKRYDLISYISDESKTAYGFRTRCDWDQMSLEDLEKMADQISQDAESEMARQRENEEYAAARLEALISDTIEMGAGDRKTAIRWILEGENMMEEWDMGYIEYSFGLKYRTYDDEFREVIREVYPEVA